MSVRPVNFPMTIKTWSRDAITTVSESKEVEPLVTMAVRRHHTIDVRDAMHKLIQVGRLLQLAYAGGKGFPCSKHIVRLMTGYQELAIDSLATCTSFVTASCVALETHRIAMLFVRRGSVLKALEKVARTGDLAKQMAEHSGKLIAQSQALCQKSADALVAATKDETLTTQQKREVETLIGTLKAQEAALRQRVADLSQAVAEEKARERKAEKDAKRANKRAFFLNMASIIMEPVKVLLSPTSTNQKRSLDTPCADNRFEEALNIALGKKREIQKELLALQKELVAKKAQLSQGENEDQQTLQKRISELEVEIEFKKKQLVQEESSLQKAQQAFEKRASQAADKQAVYAQQRASFQNQLIEANASLAESVVRLQNSHTERNELIKAIRSLEISVKTLGQITTIFQNVRLYWLGVERHCQQLANIQAIQDGAELFELGETGEFTRAIAVSGINWLALAKVNLTAENAMKSVKSFFDKVMSDLPTKKESLEIIDRVASEILNDLQKEAHSMEEGQEQEEAS